MKEGKCFFDKATILFHQCNNTNITYQQFILVYIDILHIENIVMLRCFSPPVKNGTLSTKNAFSPTVFDLQ